MCTPHAAALYVCWAGIHIQDAMTLLKSRAAVLELCGGPCQVHVCKPHGSCASRCIVALANRGAVWPHPQTASWHCCLWEAGRLLDEAGLTCSTPCQRQHWLWCLPEDEDMAMSGTGVKSSSS